MAEMGNRYAEWELTGTAAARGDMVSQIVMAYCIAVTVNDSNDLAAYRINVDNDPLFPKMVADKRLRIESSAKNAAAVPSIASTGQFVVRLKWKRPREAAVFRSDGVRIRPCPRPTRERETSSNQMRGSP